MTTLFLALSTPPKDCTSVQGQRPSPRFQVSGRGRGVSERGVPPEVRKAGGFLGSDLPSLGRCPRGPVRGGCGGGGEDAPGSGSALPAITARLIFLAEPVPAASPGSFWGAYGREQRASRGSCTGSGNKNASRTAPGAVSRLPPSSPQSPAISGALEGQSAALPHWRVSCKRSFTLSGGGYSSPGVPQGRQACRSFPGASG